MLKQVCSQRSGSKGMTLVEVLLAIMILVPLLTVVLQNFVQCSELNSMSRNTSLAVWGERNRLAEIERTPFSQIAATYDRQPFTIDGLNGIGVTYIETTSQDLLTVHATFSWRDMKGRVVGEDKDLDGVLDQNEKGTSGRLSSPVDLSTRIYRI